MQNVISDVTWSERQRKSLTISVLVLLRDDRHFGIFEFGHIYIFLNKRAGKPNICFESDISLFNGVDKTISLEIMLKIRKLIVDEKHPSSDMLVV